MIGFADHWILSVNDREELRSMNEREESRRTAWTCASATGKMELLFAKRQAVLREEQVWGDKNFWEMLLEMPKTPKWGCPHSSCIYTIEFRKRVWPGDINFGIIRL